MSQKKTKPPLEVLLGNPERTAPELSPDGTKLSWIAPVDGVLNVWVRDLGVDGDEGKPVTHDTDRGIRGYGWAQDGLHLLYVQDTGGDEDFHVYTVNLDSGEVADRTPFKKVQAQIIGTSHKHPDTVLLGINQDNPQLHDAYRLTLSTGAVEKVFSNPGFLGLLADDELTVRGSALPTPDGGIVVMVREDEDSEFRPILTGEQVDALSTGPIGFTADGKGLYALSSVGANTGRIVLIDIASGAETVVHEDPVNDVTGLLQHPITHEPIAAAVNADYLRWVVLDQDYAKDFEVLAGLGQGNISITGYDNAFTTWLVARNPASGSPVFYVYDRTAGTTRELMRVRPALDDYALAEMEPFTFTARDGLSVSGYISFPPGAERKDLPALLNVHGGPWARDSYGYTPDTQLLATRGYAVVQVNYRGSTGYGKAFSSAGDKEWAAKMHDDLLDAVDFVVGEGWVDRARVGIYGGSYGGYATLVGLTFTPEVFACGVDVVGPSDLETLIRSVPEYWKPMLAMFTLRVGDPETEADFLKSRSPISRVDAIVRPLLIGQGKNDPRVTEEQADIIVNAMKERDIPVEYLLYEDEGHGFAKPENRLHFYAAMEKFLAQHLPV